MLNAKTICCDISSTRARKQSATGERSAGAAARTRAASRTNRYQYLRWRHQYADCEYTEYLYIVSTYLQTAMFLCSKFKKLLDSKNMFPFFRSKFEKLLQITKQKTSDLC